MFRINTTPNYVDGLFMWSVECDWAVGNAPDGGLFREITENDKALRIVIFKLKINWMEG